MSYTTVEPTVIDEDLIRKAINEQVNPDIADIAKKEGIEPEEVEHLRLDYKSRSRQQRHALSITHIAYYRYSQN